MPKAPKIYPVEDWSLVGPVKPPYSEIERAYKHPLYDVWCNIKERCLNPKSQAYKYYGGRGIKICQDWVHSFAAFKDYMGPKPKDKPTVGRINNDGNYEPGNVEWQDWLTQGRNKSNNLIITYQGEKRPLSEWAEILSQGNPIISKRIKSGWSFDRALNTPTIKKSYANNY